MDRSAMTVIRLPDHHSPDAEYVSCDQWGRRMFRFIVEYPHLTTPSGRERVWSATVWAYDAQDAEARLDAIRRGGHVEGQVLEAGPY